MKISAASPAGSIRRPRWAALYVLVLFCSSIYAAFLSFKALEHYSGWHWAFWMVAALLVCGELVLRGADGKSTTKALFPLFVRRLGLWLLSALALAWTWQQGMWQFWLIATLLVHGVWRFSRARHARAKPKIAASEEGTT